MKNEEYFPSLIRASLDNDLKTIRAISTKIMRNLNKTNPELAREISEALTYHGAGLSTTRALGYRDSPQDADTRNDLLQIQNLVSVDKPIFNENIDKIIERINDERKKMDKMLALGLTPTSSILLYGEPGVGKTILARYLASLFNMNFATLDMSSSISSYLGKTGSNLKKVIDYAKEKPTLLLLDEFDAIAKKRDDSTDLGELKRVVNVLLKELEDWPPNSILIAATNHPQMLDKAIWRRFDLSLEIPLPDEDTRFKLLNEAFKDFDFEPQNQNFMNTLAKITEGMSPADIVKVTDKAKKRFILYDEALEIALLTEIAHQCNHKTVDFNKLFCKVAKAEGLKYREMATLLGKSLSAVQNYLK